jgi:hypothetical protein
MVYDSVYEANNYLRGTVRKQHFWDWFSGSKLQEGVTGTNSYSTAFPNATGWSSRGSQVSITGGVVNTNFGATDDNSAVYRTLGYDVSGDFELRIKHRFISYTSSTSGMIALADTTDTVYGPTTAGSNSVMIGVNSDSSGAHSFAFYSVENGVFTNHGDPPISTGRTGTVSNATDYWLKMTKVGNLVTINVYSDSSYSSLVTSCYGSVSSSFPSTLNVIQIGMSWTMSGRGANWTDTDLSLTSDVVGGIRWTLEQAIGTSGNTGAMVDSVDGGYAITPAGVLDAGAITFNDKRQYSYNSSVCIAVCNKIDVGGRYRVGLSADKTLATTFNDTAHCFDGASGNIYLQTANGTAGNDTASDVTANTTNVHGIKIETKSLSVELSIDGVFKVVNTTYLPLTKLQPVFLARGGGGAGNQKSAINYMEAYNT